MKERTVHTPGVSPRYLGIDYGSKRIGIAVSDPLNIIARSVCVLANDDGTCEAIQSMVGEYTVATIVVGMPFDREGNVGPKGREVKAFIERLNAVIGIPIVLTDEGFTSKAAMETMHRMGVPKKQRREKGRIDMAAAALILQRYLDERQP